MSSRWIALVLVLQIASLALTGGMLLRENRQPANQSMETTLQQVQGALYQQRELALALDRLRMELTKLLPGQQNLAPVSTQQSMGGLEEEPAEVVRASPSVAFPEAHAALQGMKKTFQDREDAAAEDNHFVAPFQERLAKQKTELLRRGTDSFHWVNLEVSLEPYQEERDPDFIEYLITEVVPELSGANPAATFEMARSVLVKVTNENSIRVAAARLLQLVDSKRWVKEVVDIITRGGTRRRDVSLRVSLLDFFVDRPKPEIADVCKMFLDDARHPSPLRTKAVLVLARQESPMVEPTLQKVLFEDHSPEIRRHALDGLYARLKDRQLDQLRKVLEEVEALDPSRIHGSVKEKAVLMLQQLGEKTE